MIHGHGDDLYKSQVQIKANFSTNVWYEADTRPLCDFLSTHLEGIFHYPEPDAGSFRKVLLPTTGLLPNRFWSETGLRNCSIGWLMLFPVIVR